MRDIKFRGWHKDPIKKWVMSEVLNIEFSSNSINTVNGSFYYQKDDSIIKLMQYTGLKDKRGVEIYEGDIVKDLKGIGVVYYYAPQFIVQTEVDIPFALAKGKVNMKQLEENRSNRKYL